MMAVMLPAAAVSPHPTGGCAVHVRVSLCAAAARVSSKRVSAVDLLASDAIAACAAVHTRFQLEAGELSLAARSSRLEA